METRVHVRVGSAQSADGLSVLEHHARQGDSPPLHLHRPEDEIFHVLEGELRLQVGVTALRIGAGDTALAPQGVPHSFRADSPQAARWLAITRGGFESLVRALSRPAAGEGLPEAGGPPTPEQMQRLAAVCAQHGIDVVGPPLG